MTVAIAGALQIVGGMCLAPLLPGLVQTLKARLQGRRGPSPLQPYRELRRLWGKAIHAHISDCDGKVHGDLPPGRGVVNFVPYLREIAALGIDGTMSIELEYPPQPEKIIEWVREAYTATDRLMREAGLPRG